MPVGNTGLGASADATARLVDSKRHKNYLNSPLAKQRRVTKLASPRDTSETKVLFNPNTQCTDIKSGNYKTT